MQSTEQRIRDVVQRFSPHMALDDARGALDRRVERRAKRRRIVAIVTSLGVAIVVLVPSLSALRPAGRHPRVAASTGSASVYVLTSSPTGPNAYAIDIATGESRLLRTFDSTGAESVVNPDLAVTPDGSSAFVAWEDASGQRLDLIDSRTGRVLSSTRISDLPPSQLPTDFISVDPVGNAFVYRIQVGNDGSVAEFVSTYDAASGLLPRSVPLEACGGEGLLTAIDTRTFAVVCPISREVRIVTVGSDGAASAQSAVALPLTPPPDDSTELPDQTIRDVVFDPTSSSYDIITESGRVLSVDVKSSTLRPEFQLALPGDSYVVQDGAVLSAAQSILYVVVGARAGYDPFRGTQVLGFAKTGGKLVAEGKVDNARPQMAASGTAVVVLAPGVGRSLIALNQTDGLSPMTAIQLQAKDVIIDVT